MRVLIACEYSGVVRNAFSIRGHYALSCDLLPTELEGNHYQGDVFDIIDHGWDLMIAHPPCTYLSLSGNRWYNDTIRYPNRSKDRESAVQFFMKLINADIDKIAIENPIGVLSTIYRKPDQIIQPYQFGDSASKSTCLWLKNLPKLEPTNIVDVEYITLKNGKRFSKWYYDTSNVKNRSQIRSRTFQGIANAMADQWG